MINPKPLPVDAATWLFGNDTGISSLAILKAAFGYPARVRMDYPHDAADFGRCLRLIQSVQGTFAGVERLAMDPHGVWCGILSHWDELAALHAAGMHWDVRVLLRSLENAKGVESGWVALHEPSPASMEDRAVADAVGFTLRKSSPARATRNRIRVGAYCLPVLLSLEKKGFARQTGSGSLGVPYYDFEATEDGLRHIGCSKRFIKQVVALRFLP